jgi:predicted NAD/FAD-dependent oxidoreductase
MKVAIIGSGLSGLVLAHCLHEIVDVELFEKARGVGGRISTRYAGDYEFDHGAQYFTAKTEHFLNFIQPYIQQGILQPWKARYVEFEKRQLSRRKLWNNNPAHYVAVPRMNSFAKSIAQDLNIHLNTKIEKLLRIEQQWILQDDQAQNYGPYDWVISTAPWPQTKHLLHKHTIMQHVDMYACYSLMLGFDKPLHLDWEIARIHDSCLSWIANNSSKPGRPQSESLVVLSSNEWANQNVEAEKEWVINQLLNELHHYIHLSPEYVNLHRWRYANVPHQTSQIFVFDKEQHLAACGDWSIGARVENAFLAAYELFKKFKDFLFEI